LIYWGLGALGAIRDCVELISEHYGKEVDLAQLPEDPVVYDAIVAADTVGPLSNREPRSSGISSFEQTSLPIRSHNSGGNH
jgi:hypothetical protein